MNKVMGKKSFIYYVILVLVIMIGTSNQIRSQTSQEETLLQNDAAAQTYLEQGNKAEAARLYNQSAYIYRTSGKYEKAIEYYEKVLKLNQELGNNVGQMITHSNLSMLYIETEQYQFALQHLKLELAFREKNKKINEIVPVLVSIAGVYNELKQFEAASDNAKRAIDLSQEINNLSLMKRSYGIAFDIYTKWGKQQEAQNYFELYSAIDKKIKDDKMVAVQTEASQQVDAANSEKTKTQQVLNVTSKELQKTAENLEESEKIAKQQKMELDLQQALINEQNALLRIAKLKTTFYAIGSSILLVFVLILTFLILRIRKANIKIDLQRTKLEKQNREITSSINYANTIQTAMLPNTDELKKIVSPFVIYRPKDIVSGDFYWLSVISEKRVFFAVVDCTGHGVPGAFMSMIGLRLLDEIVNVRKLESPSEILESLNELLREALKQEQTDNNDGMDLAICRLDKDENGRIDVTYSGAKRPVYIGRKSKTDLEILNPDRKSIGGNQPAKGLIEFSNQTAKLFPGDTLYLYSDGIVDQNDPHRKKFGRARLESILVDCLEEDAEKQKSIIESKLDEFIQDELQRDDITFAGLKII